MSKQYITFNHWKTDEEITVQYNPVDFHIPESSDRIVVWDVKEGKLVDIIRNTLVRVWEE